MVWMGVLSLFMLYMLVPHILSHATMNTLRQGQVLRDYEKLVSANGNYIFQFFSLDFAITGSSVPHYIGIRFNELSPKDPMSVVWLANRREPIPDTSGVLRLDSDGILKFNYGGGRTTAISSNQPIKTSMSGKISATLLDSGNLVLREVDSNGKVGAVLWQSFDYPTDTLLPEMKIGFNLKTGQQWNLSSWLSDQVPSPGAFKLGLDPSGSSQLIIWRRGEVYWRSGPWNNGNFQLAPELTKSGEYKLRYVNNENERYFSFSVRNRSRQLIWVLDWDNILQCILDLHSSTVRNLEDTGRCYTDINNQTVVPFKQKPSKCRDGSENFAPKKGHMDENDIGDHDYSTSLELSDCNDKCWKNCSCIAYKSAFDNGTGCTFWTRGTFISNEGYQLYLLNSELKEDSKRWWIWFILSIACALALLVSAILCHLSKKNRIGKRGKIEDKSLLSLTSKIAPSYKLCDANKRKKGENKGQDFHMFSFQQIITATDNFSCSSKLGEGGFGPVYKGILPNGQQIAIKRLSRTSGQGLVEFKNEIILIAGLQHMNLIKLLGCCIEEEEKMLIYEYMSNKSLDFFVFDPTKRKCLDWKACFNIIEGISQGLLYLHKYSRLRVIHRDLKASNILLDDKMNPKISDFGLARIFGQDENEAITNKVVGTYGYMAPEYAVNGIFSVKSDVYSFGVLLLEIISGLQNTALSRTSGPLSLIEHAWYLWSSGACLDLVDKSLLDSSCPENEVFRCVHVGLLCVQECAIDRPTMSDVAIMLTNETIPLPYPKQPGFYIGRYGKKAALLNGKSGPRSVYNVSITEMEGR